MADSKISALPASTTPLAGTEVLPIVQGGATKQVSVANLTAGRAISATELTLTTGNLIVASGQGIDFSATSHPAGMTSELLADYEEGTFTATLTCTTGTITLGGDTLTYVKVGRMVLVNGNLIVDSVSSPTGGVVLNGLPFTIKSGNAATPSGSVFIYNAVNTLTNSFVMLSGNSNATTANIRVLALGSDAAFGPYVQSGTQIIVSFMYQI
jgi:hypothetical protein